MSADDRIPTEKGWRDFELLAARIYETLAPQGAIVTHNDHIPGRNSGIDRQIDVSIRFRVAGHEFLTVLQARDRETPADVNAVGEFAAVVEDVNASKGVMICRSGFTDAAQTLARAKGIDLCNIHDAGSERWALEVRVPILWVDQTPIVAFTGQTRFEGGDVVPSSLKSWVISNDGGVTRVKILETFEQLWNEGKLPRNLLTPHRVADPRSDFALLVQDANDKPAWRPIEFALHYTVTQQTWLGSFTPDECIGILHYEDGLFVGRFPIGAVPSERGEDWIEIADPEQLCVTIPGTMITSTGWQIVEGSGQTGELSRRHVETGVELHDEGPSV